MTTPRPRAEDDAAAVAPTARALPRRAVLAAAGAVGAAGVLAACSSGSSTDGASSTSASAAQTSATPDATTATPSETGGGGGAATPLAPTADVPVEGGVIVDSPAPIVVTQPASGDFKAFTAICPHQGCTVNEVVANEIVCPCHGSRFSASDGSVLQGPATSGLAPVDVAVDGSEVVVA